jgi:hypothetical protein
MATDWLKDYRSTAYTSGNKTNSGNKYTPNKITGAGGGGGGGSWGPTTTAKTASSTGNSVQNLYKTLYGPTLGSAIYAGHQYNLSNAGSRGNTGASNFNTAPSVGSYSNALNQNVKSQEDIAEEQRKAEEARIRGIYSGLIDNFEGQIEGLQNRLPIVEGQINQSYDSTLPLLGLEQSNRITGLQGQQSNIEQSGKSQINNASRLFNELQSGGQKYAGTSVGDAFGELLGRSTSETIGGVRQQVAQDVQGIQKEMGAVNTYYDSKRTELEENKQLSLREARASFEDEIRAVQADIRAAEGDKANARADALQRYYTRLSEIKQAQYLEQVALDKWKTSQQQTLSQAQNAIFKEFLPNALMQIAQKGFSNMNEYNQWQSMAREVGSGNYGAPGIGQYISENYQPTQGIASELLNQYNIGGNGNIQEQVPQQPMDYSYIDQVLGIK